MDKERIEIQLIHSPVINTIDNDSIIRILINDADIDMKNLSKVQTLHIGAILLNASRKFIDNANKV